MLSDEPLYHTQTRTHTHTHTRTLTLTQRQHTSQASTVTGGAPAAFLRAAAEFITEVQEQTGGLERRSPRVITRTDMRTDRQKALLITAEGKKPRESGQRKDRRRSISLWINVQETEMQEAPHQDEKEVCVNADS